MWLVANSALNKTTTSFECCQTFAVIISLQICSMLEMIRNSTNQNPEAAALFYDELARIIQVGGIDPKIEVLLLVRDC